MSVREAAKLAGLDKNTILNVEAGRPVRDRTLRKIAKAYGILIVPQPAEPSDSVSSSFATHLVSDGAWVRLSLREEDEPSDIHQGIELADPAARAWLGEVGLANQFFLRLRCDRPSGLLRAAVFEVFGPSGWATQPSGEALVYVLHGRVRFTVGTDGFELGSGEAATFDRTVRHMHEPIEGPAVFLYVQVE